MTRHSKRIGVLGLAVSMALAAGTAHAKDITLAFVATNQQNPAEVSMIRGFKEEAEKLGAKTTVLDARGSVERMSNAVDDLIAQNASGIAAIILDSVVAQSWVDKANDATIPFVAVAVQVGDPQTVPFKQVYPGLSALVGQDYIVSGRRMGEAAAAMLPKDRRAKIGIVEGQPGYALVRQLNEGFTGALDKAGIQYDIIFSQPTDWTPAKGEQVCQNGLIANPDTDLIFSHAEDMAIGCAKALSDVSAKTKLVTAAGGSKIGTPLIESGEITLSMCEAWMKTGSLAAKALFEAASDPATAKARLVEYEPTLIDRDNIAAECSPPQW